MTAPDRTELHQQAVLVFFGAADAEATTPVGIIKHEDTVDFIMSKGAEALRIQGMSLPLDYRTTREQDYGVDFTLRQWDITNLSKVLSIAPTGSEVILADSTISPVLPVFSCVISSQLVDGTPIKWRADRVQNINDATINMTQQTEANLDFQIRAVGNINDPAALPKWIQNAGNVSATISTGDLTRTSGYQTVLGEGAASDVLDTISAGDLVDNEIITLTMENAAQIITLTDGHAGPQEMNLFGAANFVMAIGDTCTLQYNLGDTDWDEIDRHIA